MSCPLDLWQTIYLALICQWSSSHPPSSTALHCNLRECNTAQTWPVRFSACLEIRAINSMCWINNMNHIVVLAILPLLLLNGSESVLFKHLSLTRLTSSAKCNRQQQQQQQQHSAQCTVYSVQHSRSSSSSKRRSPEAAVPAPTDRPLVLPTCALVGGLLFCALVGGFLFWSN